MNAVAQVAPPMSRNERLLQETTVSEEVKNARRKLGLVSRTYSRYYLGLDVDARTDPSVYEPYMQDFGFLGLCRGDVVRLVNLFLKADADRTGFLNKHEFLMAVDVERTHFSTKLFQIFDADDSNKIEFLEFALALWSFCSMNPPDLEWFCFRCFAEPAEAARSREWVMRADGVQLVLEGVYGAELTKERAQAAKGLAKTIAQHGCVSWAQWQEWIKRYRQALRPLYHLQAHLRATLGGRAFWKRLAARRARSFQSAAWRDLEDALARARRKHVRGKPTERPSAAPAPVEASPRTETPEPEPEAVEPVEPPRPHRARKKKLKIVAVHGFDQAVACDDDDDERLVKPPDAFSPVRIKSKPFMAGAKRSRAETIQLLKALRHGPGNARGAREPRQEPAEQPPGEPRVVLSRTKLAAMRLLANGIQLGADRHALAPYNVLTEPSMLERSYGIAQLGQAPNTDLALTDWDQDSTLTETTPFQHQAQTKITAASRLHLYTKPRHGAGGGVKEAALDRRPPRQN